MSRLAKLDKIEMYEYTDKSREDGEGCALRWRIEYWNGQWHLTMWDSYHGEWYTMPDRRSLFDTLEAAEADLEVILEEGLTLY